jgi:hypothetical protein
MLTMSKINEIREAFEQGKKVSQIARELEVDEKTVRNYLKQKNFSPAMPMIAEERISRLDLYKLRWCSNWERHIVPEPWRSWFATFKGLIFSFSMSGAMCRWIEKDLSYCFVWWLTVTKAKA